MEYAVGSLVKARGREWVVLPESEKELLLLRPLGGADEEVTGVMTDVETVEPATFDLPDPSKVGDHISCRLLRDAVKLGFRSSAGPFRSFAKLNFEPRPYQFVPLLMALKQDSIRMLVSDDVGIGKTVEACLIAKELLERGEINRLAVLCPPHLAEQWQTELQEKFHIDAELVLPSTAHRLERVCSPGESLFDYYPHVIVSLDFIKVPRRRDDFLRTCPEFVIVDEAHTCATAGQGRGARHQRFELLKDLVESDSERHLVLVSAVPHSGNEQAFRSLLSLLRPEFSELPEDLTGKHNEHHRRQLATHFIQRRRANIRDYLDEDTPFPDRLSAERHYTLGPEYKEFFQKVLRYISEYIRDDSVGKFRKRVQWWSALGLLRCLGSSPAAAAATLRNRAPFAEEENQELVDQVAREALMDHSLEESAENMDVTPGSDASEDGDESQASRRRLLELARAAEALKGKQDSKLKSLIPILKKLLKEGYNPIVFCRFIETAEYVAEELRSALPKSITVAAVTGTLAPKEREQRVGDLGQSEGQRVLVATDCLSEGINLQQHFDAVLHYDLSWNPTRHEQREGRVDRFGQRTPEVKVITYYSTDNQIDGIVLDVLLRKHQTIRNSLGISVPVPVDSNAVMEAIFEGLELRQRGGGQVDDQLRLFDEDFWKPKQAEFHEDWERASEREKRSRTMFAQQSIQVDEVKQELDEVRAAIGSGVDVQRFVVQSTESHGGVVSGEKPTLLNFERCPLPLRESISEHSSIKAQFTGTPKSGEIYLSRTHPIVEGLSTYVMDTAIDETIESIAARCGAIRTNAMKERTVALLLRFRYHIITKGRGETKPLLAEDAITAAFSGAPDEANWLSDEEAANLLKLSPDGNIGPDIAKSQLKSLLDQINAILPYLREIGTKRGEELLESHKRVRPAKGISFEIEAQEPDILGVFLYLP